MKTLLMVYTTFISKHLTYKQRNILPTTFHENIKMNFITCRLMPLPPFMTTTPRNSPNKNFPNNLNIKLYTMHLRKIRVNKRVDGPWFGGHFFFFFLPKLI